MLKTSRCGFLTALVASTAVLGLASCEDDVVSNGTLPPPHGTFAFVTTTDYSTGSASLVFDDSTLKAVNDVTSVHSDALVRAYNGRVYVLNRQGADNIQVIDPANGFRTLKEFSVGNGADPEDIVFKSPQRAFVSRYNEDQMWIVDPNGGRRLGLIDFAWLADNDNVPEMAHMVLVGKRAFVAIQRLDRNTPFLDPTGTSYVAVFDITTELFLDAEPGTIGRQAIRLETANPFGEMVYNAASGKIWVPTVGFFGALDGGLELIDPVTLTTSGVVISEATLKGDLTDVVPLDANRGAAIISDANFNTLLVGFDLASPTSIDTIYAPGSFALQDAELAPSGRIFVTDRTPVAPGIRVFRATDFGQVTTSPINVGLPGADIEFVTGY